MKLVSKAELTEWALAADRLWLFLDYDGTLAGFAPTPEIIETNPRVTGLLMRLVGVPRIRVTVISGRRLEHVRRLVPVEGIFLAGSYGIELLTPESELIQRVEYAQIRPVLEALKPQWEGMIRGRNGFFLEDKGWALAIHARFAADEEAEEVLTHAQRMIDRNTFAEHFRILGGHKFLEIAPRLASKKETVMYLLDQYPLPDAHLLYIGDDDKDEEAFPVIHAHGGLALKVFQPSQGSSPTTADFLFESPEEALHWLAQLEGLQD